ncbi:MAG: efflux RND transporter periplasmic adaptor subunit [Thermoanaerobaculia bacterium]
MSTKWNLLTRRSSAAAIVFAAGTLAALLGGCGADEVPAASNGNVTEERLTQVQVEAVEPRPAVETIEVAADVLADRRATLAAEVAGTVEAVEADLGDRVGAGAVLIRIDTSGIATEVEEAEANFRQAEEDAARAEALFEKRSITRDRLTAARTALDVSRARLESAHIRLGDLTVRAPWAGEVASRMVEVGDYVDVGDGMLELVAVDRLKIRAEVAAEDAQYIEQGEPATLRLQALPGEIFEAEVVRIGASLTSTSRTLPIEVELANPGGRLKPGMFGRLTLPRRQLEAALLVPLAALVDYEDGKVVYVVEDGVARRRPVTPGAVIGERVAVEEGLAAGDRVIVRGQDQVADGQQVEVV